jgi:hypothetical protein
MDVVAIPRQRVTARKDSFWFSSMETAKQERDHRPSCPTCWLVTTLNSGSFVGACVQALAAGAASDVALDSRLWIVADELWRPETLTPSIRHP